MQLKNVPYRAWAVVTVLWLILTIMVRVMSYQIIEPAPYNLLVTFKQALTHDLFLLYGMTLAQRHFIETRRCEIIAKYWILLPLLALLYVVAYGLKIVCDGTFSSKGAFSEVIHFWSNVGLFAGWLHAVIPSVGWRHNDWWILGGLGLTFLLYNLMRAESMDHEGEYDGGARNFMEAVLIITAITIVLGGDTQGSGLRVVWQYLPSAALGMFIGQFNNTENYAPRDALHPKNGLGQLVLLLAVTGFTDSDYLLPLALGCINLLLATAVLDLLGAELSDSHKTWLEKNAGLVIGIIALADACAYFTSYMTSYTGVAVIWAFIMALVLSNRLLVLHRKLCLHIFA